MPMFTTSVMASSVCPRHLPERTRSVSARILSSTASTPGITSWSSTFTGSLSRLRRAVCSTARPSVWLIFSPLNMRSIQPGRSACSASSTSSAMVCSVTRFLE